MVEVDGLKHFAQALINVGAKHGSVRAEDVLPSEATVARYTKEAAEELRSQLKANLEEVRFILSSRSTPVHTAYYFGRIIKKCTKKIICVILKQ